MAKCVAGPRATKQVVGIFGCKSATAAQIYDRSWSVIEAMELADLPVIIFLCDGARTNRAFFQYHQTEGEENHIVTKTVNIFSPDGKRILWFMSDAPHLLKCIRNIFAEDHLWKNGEEISWKSIIDLFYQYKDRTLRKSCKLTENHIKLNNFSKMKVNPAAQVMSDTVAHNLDELHGDTLKETITFIRLVDRFFDCLNGHNTLEGRHHLKPDRNPYTRTDDPRFKFLAER